MERFEAIAPSAPQLPIISAPAVAQPTSTNPGHPFLKDAIACGTYKHPTQGFTLAMTRERMDKLAGNFARMTENGVKVPIYTEHKGGTLATLGYVTGLARGDTPAGNLLSQRRNGDDKTLSPDTLYAVCDFSDPESETIARRVKQVSIQINPKFKDGRGNDYGEAIEHVAVTPEPIVPGQKDFEQLAFALSLTQPPAQSADSVISLYLADGAQTEGAVSMAKEDEKKKEEEKVDEEMAVGGKAFGLCRTALSAHLGADHEDVKGLKPDNAVPMLIKHLTALKEAHGALNAAHVANAKLAASRDIPAPVLRMIAKSSETELDALSSRGCITPKVCAGLKELLVGKADARNVMALSLEGEDGTEDNLVGKVVKILADNTPVALGEHTKSQSVALSREVPGAAKADSEKQKKVTEDMTNMANRGR